MKPLLVFVAILTLLIACSTPAPTPEQPQQSPSAAAVPQAAPLPPQTEEGEPVAIEQPPTEQAAEEEAEAPPIAVPTGATPITIAESTKVVEVVDYAMDRTDQTATMTKVSFLIRNTGREPIRPRVVMQLDGQSFHTNKIWDFERLPPGYKVRKDIKLAINLDAPKLMKIMKFTVQDLDMAMIELGSDTRQFVPIPKQQG